MTHGKLNYGNGYWLIEASPHVMVRVKRLLPRANPNRAGRLLLTDTAEIARDIEWLTERYPLKMSAKVREHLRTRADEHRATEKVVERILSGKRPRILSSEPARPAREYQLAAADLAITTGRLLLCDDLGLGKSMSGILVLGARDALPAVVVCPTHLQRQWQEEIVKTYPTLRSHIVRKLTAYDPAEHRDCDGEDPDVLIIPYSKLRGWAYHLTGQVRTVIFDEAQELRRSDSAKWMAAAQVADGARFRVGLTATPVYNYGGEIHTVLQVIAPDVLGTREEFSREWCSDEHGYRVRSNGHISVSDPAGLGVYLREQGVMLRRTRKEVGRELPEVTRVAHSIDSDVDVFEELAADAADLAEVIVHRAAAREELWRAAGEFDWKMRRATGLAKAGYVAEFVKLLLETDEQVALFGWHRDVYAIWEQKLKAAKPAFYTGTESSVQKNRSRDRFLAGDARVLIMSLRSGAGLDGLQEATSVAVFGELDWSPGMHDQCIGRLHRDGQDEPVVAYFLVSDHGADPLMAEVLNLKRMQSAPIHDPDQPLFTEAVSSHDRIRRLAQDVLARRNDERKAA